MLIPEKGNRVAKKNSGKSAGGRAAQRGKVEVGIINFSRGRNGILKTDYLYSEIKRVILCNENRRFDIQDFAVRMFFFKRNTRGDVIVMRILVIVKSIVQEFPGQDRQRECGEQEKRKT